MSELSVENECLVAFDRDVLVIPLAAGLPRVECGPLRIGDLPVGHFIRGDNALYLSHVLGSVVTHVYVGGDGLVNLEADPIAGVMINSFLGILKETISPTSTPRAVFVSMTNLRRCSGAVQFGDDWAGCFLSREYCQQMQVAINKVIHGGKERHPDETAFLMQCVNDLGSCRR